MEHNIKNTVFKNSIDLKDYRVSKVLVMQFIVQAMLFFFKESFIDNKIIVKFIMYISIISVGILFISVFDIILKRSLSRIIYIYLIVIIFSVFNIIIYPDSKKYFNSYLIEIFIINIPTFIYLTSIKNVDIFDYILDKSKKILFFINFISLILIILTNNRVYYLGYSYLMSIPTMLYLISYMKNKKIKDLIIFIIGSLVIVYVGARSPLLNIGILLVLCVVYLITKRLIKSGKIVLLFLILSSLIVMLFSLNEILYIIARILLMFGIEGRTIDLLMNNPFSLSGRNEIYNIMISAIKTRPILGYGFFGDRILLENTSFIGQYSHNIFLELMVTFGLLVGSLISIYLIYNFVKIIFSKNILRPSFIFVILGFVGLYISDSFIISQNFIMFLGLIILYAKKEKIKLKMEGF